MPTEITLSEIASRVLGHFQKNAHAMDSVEGIARFWVREDPRVVERCLGELHARGLLQKRTIGGTDFYCLSPEEGAPASAIESSRSTSPRGLGRILVIDDDPAVLELLSVLLRSAGHQVICARGGQEALELFRSAPSDVVVTDALMPGMSGMDVLAAVKQASPDTEVIVVTAYATLETALLALRQGAYDLITKPLTDLEALDRVVRRALEKRHLSRENRILLEALKKRNAELRQTVARMAAAHEIGRSAGALLNLPSLYDSLARLVAQHLNARRVSILLGDPGADSLSVVASVGLSEGSVLGERVRLGERIAGRVAASLTPVVIEDIRRSQWSAFATPGRYQTPSCLLTPLTLSSPLRRADRQVAVIAASDKHSGDPFTEQDREFLSTISQHVSVALENAHVVREMEEGYLHALTTLVQAFEEVDPQRRGHTRRVIDLVQDVGRSLSMPPGRVDLLRRAAGLHDLGRLLGSAGGNGHGQDKESSGGWAPAELLNAERLLAAIPSLRDVWEIILRAADCLAAEEHGARTAATAIPLESRVLALCDELDRRAGGASTADGAASAGSAGAGSAAGRAEQRRQALRDLHRRLGQEQNREVLAALGQLVEERGGQ
jgi:response regulator RpfG family c-di-GMP phosphodiesterase